MVISVTSRVKLLREHLTASVFYALLMQLGIIAVKLLSFYQ